MGERAHHALPVAWSCQFEQASGWELATPLGTLVLDGFAATLVEDADDGFRVNHLTFTVAGKSFSIDDRSFSDFHRNTVFGPIARALEADVGTHDWFKAQRVGMPSERAAA